MSQKRKGKLIVPTTSPLPDSLRLPPSSSHVWRTLSKLSRPSLLSLAAQWCEEINLPSCGPYVLPEDEEDDLEAPYEAEASLAAVESLYSEELPLRKGSKREVIDRMLEGDWRKGISMKQLAMAETRYILENPTANRWTALRLAPHGERGENHDYEILHHLPRLHVATFVHRLQQEISPVAKAHFHIEHALELPITMLRIYLHDTPYNTASALNSKSATGKAKVDAPKSIFVVFPTNTPYVYVSLSSSGAILTDPESKSLQRFIVEAIPKALSQSGQRFDLRSTAFSARSLSALLAHRGAERSSAAAGGWSIFITDSKGRNTLDFRNCDSRHKERAELDTEADKENSSVGRGRAKRPFEHADPQGNIDAKTRKRLRLLAESRFGEYGKPGDEKGLHNFSVRFTDAFERSRKPRESQRRGARTTVADVNEDESSFKPDIKLSFHGSHVFAGLRMLVENGVIDGERMPGWMSGEVGVSVGTVRDGRIEAPQL